VKYRRTPREKKKKVDLVDHDPKPRPSRLSS
jgi:hypothetical protein